VRSTYVSSSKLVGAIVLVDTGPLVALFDPSDRDHPDCMRELGRLKRCSLTTTLAVLTEAIYLLGFSNLAQQSLLAFVGAGALEVAEFSATDVERAAALMKKYADLPMDFADATLVVLAERYGTPHVFTLDRRDFGVYRFGRRVFRIIPAASRY
jgi:predicted nucleic acid-binding protein